MPLRRHTCPSCRHGFQQWIGLADEEFSCPKCGGTSPVKKKGTPRTTSTSTTSRSSRKPTKKTAKRAATPRASRAATAPQAGGRVTCPFKGAQVGTLVRELDGLRQSLRSSGILTVERLPRGGRQAAWTFDDVAELESLIARLIPVTERTVDDVVATLGRLESQRESVGRSAQGLGLGRQLLVTLGRKAAGELTVGQQLAALDAAIVEHRDTSYSLRREVELLGAAQRAAAAVRRRPAFGVWARFPHFDLRQLEKFASGEKVWTARDAATEQVSRIASTEGVDLNALRSTVRRTRDR